MLETNGSVSTGTVTYGDMNLTNLKTNAEWEKIRGGQISTVFQDPMTSLNPIKTIGSQISETIIKHQGKSSEEAKAIAIDLMNRVGIPEAEKRYDEYPFQYSGGMRQRIVIAIALSSRPKVLICDEPTTALDVTIQAQIIALLKELKEEYGFAMIFITHDLGVVASIADKVAVMYSGEIVEYGTVEDIFYDSRHPYTWLSLKKVSTVGLRRRKLVTGLVILAMLFNPMLRALVMVLFVIWLVTVLAPRCMKIHLYHIMACQGKVFVCVKGWS